MGKDKNKIELISKGRDLILKFNPYHGYHGYFSTRGGATSMTFKPGQGKMYDNAIAREKERAAASGGGGRSEGGEGALRNPTGNIKEDYRRETSGADYAISFKTNDRTGELEPSTIDLNSKAKTGKNGDIDWAPEALANLEKGTRYFEASPVYMVNKRDVEEATSTANKVLQRGGSRSDAMKVLQDEIVKRSVRSLDKQYLTDKEKARQVNEMKRRDENVQSLQNRINEHAKKMAEVDQEFRGSYSHERPTGDQKIREKYLSMKKQADQYKKELREAQNSADEAHRYMEKHYPEEYGHQEHHTFVNGWGEATHRQIESPSWNRWQRKNDKEIQARLRLW